MLLHAIRIVLIFPELCKKRNEEHLCIIFLNKIFDLISIRACELLILYPGIMIDKISLKIKQQ